MSNLNYNCCLVTMNVDGKLSATVKEICDAYLAGIPVFLSINFQNDADNNLITYSYSQGVEEYLDKIKHYDEDAGYYYINGLQHASGCVGFSWNSVDGWLLYFENYSFTATEIYDYPIMTE